ncbi:MAG: O-methyltransferase, partial [Candidatus Aminicenantales bacterium]
MRTSVRALLLTVLLALTPFVARPAGTASPRQKTPAPDSKALDDRVWNFLQSQKDQWREENVTEADGRFLHDLIVKRRYTRALEIGTSTGHSGIWQAWALSKTGGRLVTIEIDEFRHLRAVQNFKASGLEDRIDARLADAHELVQELPGPFDFVFIDADKNWTLNYFKALLPKLEVGGCFAVHNVVSLGFMQGIRDFLAYVRGLDYMETVIDTSTGGGISLSTKKKNPA